MHLTKKEATWLSRLQDVLDECPSTRLGFYTVGDPILTVYDKRKEERVNALIDEGRDFCTAVQELDAELDTLEFPSHVHSTSG